MLFLLCSLPLESIFHPCISFFPVTKISISSFLLYLCQRVARVEHGGGRPQLHRPAADEHAHEALVVVVHRVLRPGRGEKEMI